MAYVVTRLCIDCVDMGCVEVCPVECIYTHNGPPTEARPNMLYIHPTECINCGACEPECPWQAIYEDQEMPAGTEQDVQLNALCETEPASFNVAKVRRGDDNEMIRKPMPSEAEVAANRARHGL